jgi:type I restriction enzyme S subunit
LGDIADIVGGGTPSTGNQSYWDGDIDWYAPAEIADQIYANSSQKKITGLGYENSSAKMLPPGTVLFTSRAGIGKTAILTRKGCTNQGFQSIVPHRGELDSYFIFSRTEELKRYGELVGAGSTFVEVSGKQMAVMELMMPPTMREQQTIGGFFQQLDHLITLHQRQPFLHSTPVIYPIAQLITVFYTSSWEQRKLGDISEIKTGPFGSTLHADDYVSDGTPIITTEHFKTGTLPRSKNGLPQVSDADYKRLTAYTLDDGDIVFSRVGSVDINALITPFQSNWLFSGRVLRVRPQTNISSQFLHTRLETGSIKADIRARAVGQTMPSINTEILKITPLVLPTSAAEQEQIGSYFAAIDNLITLHQRKGKAAVSGCFLNCSSIEKVRR